MIVDPVYYHVANYLGANGFGVLGSTIFGGEWGGPDEQILVIEGVGVPSELKELYEMPSVQIICRGARNGITGSRDVDVYRTAKVISDFLLNLPDSVDMGGVCYSGFEPSSNIVPLGKDENERFLYSMNFTTFRDGTGA